MDRELLKILRERQKCIYEDPKSILKRYDEFLMGNGIYHSFNQDLFFKSIKNKKFLCRGTLLIYFEANYDNEKLFLLECLHNIGYDTDSLVQLVLDIFKRQKNNEFLWQYADFLYTLKNYKYMNDYLKIIMDKDYGINREMLILLVGESKINTNIPYLIELSKDDTVRGHVLAALSNYDDNRIMLLMEENVKNPKKWISDISKEYISKHRDLT